MSQQDRRRDPYPWTWEPAAALLGVVGAVLLIGLRLGQAVASGLTTGHWQLAPLHTWLISAPALLEGDTAAGLPSGDQTASPGVFWTATSVVELTLLLPTLVLLRRAARRWSPGTPRGFASPSEVEQVLGVTRLRRTAHLIRPDLHPRHLGPAVLPRRRKSSR